GKPGKASHRVIADESFEPKGRAAAQRSARSGLATGWPSDFRDPFGNLSHVRHSRLPLPSRWTQTRATPLCQLQRPIGQNHWLLRTQSIPLTDTQGCANLGPPSEKSSALGIAQ